jgi:hypothetical protein
MRCLLPLRRCASRMGANASSMRRQAAQERGLGVQGQDENDSVPSPILLGLGNSHDHLALQWERPARLNDGVCA